MCKTISLATIVFDNSNEYLYVIKFFMQIVQSSQKNGVTQQPSLNSILHDFFDRYSMQEFQKEIWNLMVAYCGQGDNEIPTSISRSNTAFFCANINVLLNELHAVWADERIESHQE